MVMLSFIAGLCFLLMTVLPSNNIVVHADLAYGNPVERQVLDLYMPKNGADPLPVLFLLHGGGYVVGSKSIVAPYAEYFAEQGYAVVVPNYRLASRDPYPAAIEDAFCALAWTAAHAEKYNLDTSRLVLIGESAGANAAAMLATVDEPLQYLTDCAYTLPDDLQPQALITYYLYSDLTTCAPNECGLVRRASEIYLDVELDGLSGDNLREAWGEASPLYWMDESEPPTLLIHGLDDEVVPPSESEAFAAALTAVDVPIETLFITDAPHGFIEKFEVAGSLQARGAVEDYLKRLWDTASS